jgi:site-specific recombinase XerD
MDQSTQSQSASSPPLEELLARALQHLQDLGYSPETLDNHRWVWRAFARFCQAQGVTGFSEPLVQPFLEARGVGASRPAPPRVRCFAASMRILTEFAIQGHFRRFPVRIAQDVPLPKPFVEALEAHERFCGEYLRLRSSTVATRTRNLRRFLQFLHYRRTISTLKELRPADLSEYVLGQQHKKPAAIARCLADIRSLLRHLAMQGVVAQDLVKALPKIRVPRLATIPPIWEAEELDKLLAAVDRTSPKGKRDYAILLLAGHLGLRTADIRGLRLEHLHWEEGRIEFPQSKTGVSLTLPLIPAVGEAIIDYLRHGRPPTKHRQVFLRLHAPFDPLWTQSLRHIVAFYRRRAGVRGPRNGGAGLHSLRHTLATRLLRAGVPLETISQVLGHVSSESTRVYTKVDLDALRGVALDPEEVGHA